MGQSSHSGLHIATHTLSACLLQAPPLKPCPPQHPSLEPGVGRRWGWNVQYGATAEPAAAQQHQAGPLQHIHHTSLGRLALGDHDDGGDGGGGVDAQALLQPGLHTPTAPRWVKAGRGGGGGGRVSNISPNYGHLPGGCPTRACTTELSCVSCRASG